MDSKEFSELVESLGYKTRPATIPGEGQCFSFLCDNGLELHAAALIVSRCVSDQDRRNAVGSFGSARTRNLGHATVIMFPNLLWIEDAEPEPKDDFERDRDADAAQEWAADEGERLGKTQ